MSTQYSETYKMIVEGFGEHPQVSVLIPREFPGLLKTFPTMWTLQSQTNRVHTVWRLVDDLRQWSTLGPSLNTRFISPFWG